MHEMQSPPDGGHPERTISAGHRQGIITAITVLLGFSLAFLRFWGFEAPGQWTLWAAAPTIVSIAAVMLQLVALYRSLLPEDDEEREYRKTLAWFMASAAVLLIGFLLAFVVPLAA
jgi:hypothetical protein